MKMWLIVVAVALAIGMAIAWPGGDIPRRECLRGYYTNAQTGEIRLYRFLKDYDNHVVTCFWQKPNLDWEEDKEHVIGLYYAVKYGANAQKEALKRLGY